MTDFDKQTDFYRLSDFVVASLVLIGSLLAFNLMMPSAQPLYSAIVAVIFAVFAYFNAKAHRDHVETLINFDKGNNTLRERLLYYCVKVPLTEFVLLAVRAVILTIVLFILVFAFKALDGVASVHQWAETICRRIPFLPGFTKWPYVMVAFAGFLLVETRISILIQTWTVAVARRVSGEKPAPQDIINSAPNKRR